MDKIIEEKFVKKFIIKEKRERTLYELCSMKKRDQILHRLFNLLDKRYAVVYNDKISDEEFFISIKNLYNVNKECYVIADSIDDGKVLPFKEAFNNMVNDCCDYLIICGDNLVAMKEEVIYGPPSKIILYKE